MSAEPRTPLHYTIIPDVHRHVFSVRLHISGDYADGVTLFMPNWIAGSYMLRDFARHIVRIRAFNDWEQELKLTPTSQYSWKIDAFISGMTVEYEVFAHDNSVRAAFLDSDTGFFNATSVCLCVEQLAHAPHLLTFEAPQHQSWEVATQLKHVNGTPARAFGDYLAQNYDELADTPVRMGNLTWLEFIVEGVPHTVAISGEVPHLNTVQLRADMFKICSEHLNLFRPKTNLNNAPDEIQSFSLVHPLINAPFESYLFLIDARATGYGGLEHRASTALLASRDSLPQAIDSDSTRRKAYLEFLGLISHEYFHSWNVKRIKPASFIPYNLTQPANTNLLWFFEGVTSYYDDLMLLRAGILDETQYLELLDNHLKSVMNHSGAKLQSVVQAGHYAWTKYYQPTENSLNATVSYYTKGALIALCLDLFIRHNSQHEYSLDDVMRALWHDFGRNFYSQPTEQQRGIKLADIQKYVNRYAHASADHLLYVALFSTQALPLNLLFLSHGWHVKYTHPKTSQLGASVKKTDAGWLLERVATNSIAERASLAPQDVLVALNRFKLDKHPDEVLSDWPLNTDMVAHYWRDGVLKACALRNQISLKQKGIYHIERAQVRAGDMDANNSQRSPWPFVNTTF